MTTSFCWESRVEKRWRISLVYWRKHGRSSHLLRRCVELRGVGSALRRLFLGSAGGHDTKQYAPSRSEPKLEEEIGGSIWRLCVRIPNQAGSRTRTCEAD